MAGAYIEIRADDAEVQAALTRLAAATGDLRPVLKNIGEVLRKSTSARFNRSIDPDGTPWAPLKPATIRAKVKRGRRFPDRPLVGRGQLGRGIFYQVEGADTVRVGTAQPYGAIHQFGGDIPIHARSQKANYSVLSKDAGKLRKGMWRFRGKDAAGRRGFQSRWLTIGAHVIRIPARPFLGISAEDRIEILAEIGEHLDRAASARMGGGDAG